MGGMSFATRARIFDIKYYLCACITAADGIVFVLQGQQACGQKGG